MVRRYTTEEWIAKAKTKHGDLYDYSKVEFRGQQYKVKIGCAIHGFFEQNAGSHTNQGCGCPLCADIENGNKRRVKIERFLEKAALIHGEKYDYSRVEYKTAKTLVTIGCNACGSWFEQSPDKHTNAGRGCLDCGAKRSSLKRRLTTEQFIHKAKELHGEMGDYSTSIYTTRNDEIKIWCNNCEIEFSTNAGSHLEGVFGCSSCRYSRTSSTQMKPHSQWIADAMETHGSDYDYSKAIYRGNKKKVQIRCKKCKINFMQEAKAHILGQGCPICRYDKVAEKKTIPLEVILQRCKDVHGDKWNYNWKSGEYRNTRERMPIECKEHGTFFQSMMKHLSGQGCPSCAPVGFDPSKPGYYYVNKIFDSEGEFLYFKGGISGDWERRLEDLRSGLPNSYTIENEDVVYFENGHDARTVETKILQLAIELRVKEKPQNFDGGHELFSDNPFDFASDLFE